MELSPREERRLDRALLRLHMTLGASMPWSLYEAQNKKARESYHRQRWYRDPIEDQATEQLAA